MISFGIIIIPSIEVETVVRQGTTPDVLKHSVRTF